MRRGAELREGEFHRVADAMLESVQEMMDAFIEDQDIAGGDVEYGVRCMHSPCFSAGAEASLQQGRFIEVLDCCHAARRADRQARLPRHLRVQQADAQPPDLALIAAQVRLLTTNFSRQKCVLGTCDMQALIASRNML